MIKGSDNFQTGFVLGLVGAGAMLYSSLPDKKIDYNTSIDQKKSLKTIIGIAGGVMALVGIILEVDAFSHYRKAGLLLTQNSLGIQINL